MNGGRANNGDEMRTRQCAVSRDMLSIDQLVRFVEAPDSSIVPDVKAKLPGRGVWITCRREMLVQAVKSGVFARSLKKKVTVNPELPDQLDRLLLKCVIQRLSLATKAGLVTKGFVKVAKRLEKGEFVALLHAHDGAEDGKRKLNALLNRAVIDLGIDEIEDEMAKYATAPIDILSISELSLATGGENVVHSLIKEGGASSSFLNDLMRLKKYRDNVERARAA